MEKHNGFTDESLNHLLRNFLLDEKNIDLNEDIMDMNAAIVFASETSVALPMEKENVLIADLETLLKNGRDKRGWWWLGLLIVLIGGLIAWFAPHEVPMPTPKETVFTGTEHFNTEFDPVPYQGREGASPNIAGDVVIVDSSTNDSVFVDDSLNQQVPVNNGGKSNHTRLHIPVDYGYEEYPVAAPDPVFPAKPSPDNFKVKQKTYAVDTFRTGQTMFVTTSPAVTINCYEGEPFKSGMNDFILINYGEYTGKTTDALELPWQVMCYSNPDDVNVWERERNGNKYGNLKINTISSKAVQLATEPFYFSKYEVTNAEYRQFLNWVRVANGFGNKRITSVTIDTVLVTDPNDKSGEQFTLKGQKYRIQRKSEILEDYNKVYRYIFFNASDELISELGSQSLNVYPDSTVWVNDFNFSYNEPMRDYYLWHPAYDNYPVVGVSWFQAMAFLDWKTFMHQKQFDTQNVPYLIEYSLPSEIEWELACNISKKDGMYFYDFKNSCSDGWMCNLGVRYSNDDAYDRPDYLKNLFTNDQYYQGDYIRDGFFHTGPVRLTKGAEMHVGPVDICWLDGNVSEWMMESYTENWKPFFEKHIAAMEVDNRESTQLAKQIEILYDKGNDANGRLIRGSNWYDERFGSKPGSSLNEAGLSPRRYIDPKEQHSTVGFRYVVRVRYKDEAQRLQ